MSKKIDKNQNHPLRIEDSITHHSNDKIESKTPYVSGKKHGAMTWWWDDDKKRQEAYYIAGEDYARIEWRDNGSVIKRNLPT